MSTLDFQELLRIVNDSRGWFGNANVASNASGVVFAYYAKETLDVQRAHWYVDISWDHASSRNGNVSSLLPQTQNAYAHEAVESFLNRGLSVTYMEKSPATGRYTSLPTTYFHKSNWTRIPDEAYRSGYKSLAEYRAYLVNHELGHVLGSGHRVCSKAGTPAPLMLQQTKGTRGCTPNPWPLNYEVTSAKTKGHF